MSAKPTLLFSSLLLVAVLSSARAADVLVPPGSVWKYLDNGSDQGTAWRAAAFNDTSWASGPAQLGYGDGDESTVVGFGPNASAKYITTYFRRSFSVADASIYQSAVVRLLRDDGAVVYLNGTEIFRSNMPGGNVGFQTLASAAIDDVTFHSSSVNPALLVTGNNVLAVEIHQANATSSDISFDLELLASTTAQAPLVTRGPYLQLGTPTSIVVRWRTDIATDSRVRYGGSPGSLTAIADNSTVTTEHEVQLSGLTADTLYYYSVGSTSTTLAGGDTSHFFVTFPAAGAPVPTRIWVLGDSGTADAGAQAVRNAYFNATGSRHTDLWLMLGDNAYNSGTDAEYQAAVFNMYPTMLRKSVLLSTRGNHEADANTYFNTFTLPRNGEAGGLASGTEAYYSFDFGNIHFICLDAFSSDRSVNSPQATWLQNDLAATTRDWIVAFWHHPPYSKGSHNSDSEVELIEMRENMLPILEDAGVDLVLCGHSHSYERSYLIDGHYGFSSTFATANVVDGGTGRDATPYQKPAGLTPHAGAVYTVAGSSGHTSGGRLDHPAMIISLNVLGSVVLDFQTNRLDLSFLDSAGAVRDYFTLLKSGTAPPPTPPEPPANLTAASPLKKKINLNWVQSPSPAVTQNRIYRATTSGGPYTLIATISAATSYQNSGLTSGRTYYYVVTAVNTSGLESPASNQASATAR